MLYRRADQSKLRNFAKVRRVSTPSLPFTPMSANRAKTVCSITYAQDFWGLEVCNGFGDFGGR